MATRRKQDDRLPLVALNSDPDPPQDDATSKKRSRHPHKLCLRFIAVAGAIFVLQYVYYKVELLMDDPEKEGMFFMPVRYFSAKFWEKAPATATKTFHLRPENAFVLNLDADTQRWKRFQTTQNALSFNFTRFGAHRWDKNDNALQQGYAKKYPWLKQSSANKRYGDAGCTMSHILLLERIQQGDDDLDYAFIFEDDARLLGPFITRQLVEAPADAHVVFLVPTVTKTVQVTASAVRVLQGYGAYGYLITKEGAGILLHHLQRYSVPIDVALAGGSPDLRVYRSFDWPAVVHVGDSSSRRRNNG
jgi:hypothetical protein